MVSFSNILFISLTVSPSEKYSSSTSLAVRTRSRLAPVILRERERMLVRAEISLAVSPDTFISDIDGVLVLRQRHGVPPVGD